MNLRFDVTGGVNFGILNSAVGGGSDTGGDSPWGFTSFGGADLLFNWYIKPDISLAIDAGYRYAPGLYSGVSGTLGVAFHVPFTQPQIRVADIKSTTVLPAFKNYYLNHPVLRIDLTNGERFTANNLTVRVLAGSANEEGPVIYGESIGIGKTVSIYVPVRWKDEILSRDGTSAETIDVEIGYTASGTKRSIRRSVTCAVLGHNNFLWQGTQAVSPSIDKILDAVSLADDGKVAVFVDPSDPDSISLTQDIQKQAQACLGFDGLGAKYRAICSTVAYLQSRGIHYQTDPDSVAYGSAKPGQVDFVRYPSETLEAGYGDCDDLSVLLASLLEASGVSVAFVTVPGHIYVAADPGLDEAAIDSLFGDSMRFIVAEGKIWIPIEVTAIGGGMKNAWDMGFSEWDGRMSGERSLFPLDEAWAWFPPDRVAWKKSASAYRAGDKFAQAVQSARDGIALAAIDRARSDAMERIPSESDAQKGGEYGRLAYREFVFGQLETALSDIRQAIALAPTYANFYNAGMIAYRMGKNAESIRLINQALSVRDSEKARALLATVRGEKSAGATAGAIIAKADATSGAAKGNEAETDLSWEQER